MAPLREQYLARIRKWDWPGLIEEAQQNLMEVEEGETPYGSTFIGSVLYLSPSGKYYTPFANGNVDACDQCSGSGETKKLYQCQRCNGLGERTVGSFMVGGETFDYCRQRLIAGGLEPIPGTLTLFKCNGCGGAGMVSRSCNRCGGLGSYEAYQDQEFWAALDQVADDHDGWIEGGEGDPLDTFFCVAVEVPDEDAEEEVEATE